MARLEKLRDSWPRIAKLLRLVAPELENFQDFVAQELQNFWKLGGRVGISSNKSFCGFGGWAGARAGVVVVLCHVTV